MICLIACVQLDAKPEPFSLPAKYSLLIRGDLVPDIRVSPNPATDYFVVSGTTSFRKIQVYNIIGKEVKTFTASTDNEYDIENLPAGIYILRFLDNSNQLIKAIKLYKR